MAYAVDSLTRVAVTRGGSWMERCAFLDPARFIDVDVRIERGPPPPTVGTWALYAMAGKAGSSCSRGIEGERGRQISLCLVLDPRYTSPLF